MNYESALIVRAPEVESLVKAYRDRYDPAAADGVPAHVTILYPFKSPFEITADVVSQLEQLFSACVPFAFELSELRRFPEVVYLAPYPDAPLRELTRRVSKRFPEHPPYRGVYADVVPHLTIAQLPEQDRLHEIATEFLETYEAQLPICVRVNEVTLMDNSSGKWRVRRVFALGAKPER